MNYEPDLERFYELFPKSVFVEMSNECESENCLEEIERFLVENYSEFTFSLFHIPEAMNQIVIGKHYKNFYKKAHKEAEDLNKHLLPVIHFLKTLPSPQDKSIKYHWNDKFRGDVRHELSSISLITLLNSLISVQSSTERLGKEYIEVTSQKGRPSLVKQLSEYVYMIAKMYSQVTDKKFTVCEYGDFESITEGMRFVKKSLLLFENHDVNESYESLIQSLSTEEIDNLETRFKISESNFYNACMYASKRLNKELRKKAA